MADELRLSKRSSYRWDLQLFLMMLVFFGISAHAAPTDAADFIDFKLGGKPLKVMGYMNQSVQFGIGGDYYDTKQGFQSAIFQFLLETGYVPYPDVKLFVSTGVNVDWAYPILEHDDTWREREFNKSRDNRYILDDYETILKEAHVTWTPGRLNFRLGKQIVVWGETDGVRLMDQINPQDARRGITDVEFETTIIPIWLLKTEYYPGIHSTWIQDLGFEFVFNPNAHFIADKLFGTGNDVHGIWAANASIGEFLLLPVVGFIPGEVISLLPPPLRPLFERFPVFQSRVGSMKLNLDEPDDWDSDYFEYGLRLKTVVRGSVITLNGFYGRANSPVTRTGSQLPEYRLASDGVLIVHPTMEGFYPLFKFVGATFARDFENLSIRALGNIAPVLRMEALYAFNSTFVSNGKLTTVDLLAGKSEDFEKYDEIRYAVGLDWKVKILWLNPRDSFSISPQFIHQHIVDFPSDYGLVGTGGPVEENNYTTTLMLRTTYFRSKLAPVVFWQRSYQGSVQGDMIMTQLSYEWSYRWNYTVQAVWFENKGMEPLDHKDNVTFTVAYRF